MRAPQPSAAGVVPSVGATLRVFLFADIRGFTRYTEEHGAAAAAALVEELVGLARRVAHDWHGELRGTWGDQVLLVFGSARDGVCAGLDLQRLVRVGGADNPLRIGVGLDAGEPSGPVDRQAGAALNVAARLCARAGAGEILATRELAHLAGRLPDVGFVDRGPAVLKGVAGRIPLIAVVPEATARRERRLDRRLRRGLASRPWLPWAAIGVASSLLAGLLLWTQPWKSPPGPLPADAVAVLDSQSGQVRDAIGLGKPSAGVAMGPDAFWITEPQSHTVTRVDRVTHQIHVVPVDAEPVAAAVHGTDVWVAAAGANKVTRVNTVIGQRTISVPVGAQPRGITVGFDRVWVTSQLEETVTVLDAGTGAAVHTVEVGAGPVGIAVGLGRVWVANSRENTVMSLDPKTLTVDGTYPVGSGPSALAVSAGGVWVVNGLGQSVTHIDPTRSRDSVTIRVGDLPGAIAADDSGVWVGNLADGSVSRIDPATDQVVRTFALGASPSGLAVSGSQLWAATTPFAAASHRGGTLTVGAAVQSIDPQASWDSGALELVYDRLLGLQRTGGPGYGLTANLAAALPAPTDGGKTWSVRLRAGIHYSDGRAVEPADFRRGIERALTVADGTAATYFAVVRGAERCKPLAACHLDEGITTTSDTVTFHLGVGDPDFGYKLALLAAAPVPPGVDPYSSGQPVPGTGPYYIQSFTPPTWQTQTTTPGLLTLTRNPHFQVRSAAAKQGGYVDVLRFVQPPDQLNEALMAANGIDVVEARGYPALRALESQYPDRYRTQSVAGTHHIVLDTHSKPFSDLRARQAVAFALDRKAIAAALFGGEVSCHLNPPGYPGSQSPCRFTAGTQTSPTWNAPDIDRAKQLVRESGTTGDVVNVHLTERPTGRALGQLLSRTLTQIGYRPAIHYDTQDMQFANLDDPSLDMQMGWGGWVVDYPGWSQFYDGDGRCTDTDPTHPSGPGIGTRHYCNPALDQVAEQARRTELSDRHGAWRKWTAYFNALEEQAALIPFDIWTREYFVSKRVGNVQINDFWGAYGLFYEQLWVT